VSGDAWWISGIHGMVPCAAPGLYGAIAVGGDLPAAREPWWLLSQLMGLEFSAFANHGQGPHWFSVMKTTLDLVRPPVGDSQLPLQPRRWTGWMS
jgi:hypothetical protein